MKEKKKILIPAFLAESAWPAGNSERARGISFSLLYFNFHYFLKYETIVSRNGLSLGYSERDTSSV